MRWIACVLVCACSGSASAPAYRTEPPAEFVGGTAAHESQSPELAALASAGSVVGRMSDFAFDGGRIEFEMRRDGDHVIEVARNHYAVPVMMQWQLESLDNLEPLAPVQGVQLLPPAADPNGDGAPVVLTTLQLIDPTAAYHRELQFHARFGDPNVRPSPYTYRLPYRTGTTFSVLQGFHGTFSHRGSNEFAVDFDCPVATHVVAARPGVIVATNAAAQGSGTTPDFLEYKRTNFVLVLHDDGTLGEYMHLSPSGVVVHAGQRVRRGDELGLSGNTGFSSTPHLHFQVMTAATDGVSAQSFPFRFAFSKGRDGEPVQGRAYPAWE